MSRVIIGGGPRTGKTFLSRQFEHARHTDDLIHLGWAAVKHGVYAWMLEPPPWCIEGVATVRGLRYWLELQRVGTPCDRLIWCRTPKTIRNDGQESLARGCETIFLEILPELSRRDVDIVIL